MGSRDFKLGVLLCPQFARFRAVEQFCKDSSIVRLVSTSVQHLRAVVLAAGMGRRLRTETNFSSGIPKALLRIRGRTLLERMVDDVSQLGVVEVRIVAGFGLERVVAHVEFLRESYHVPLKVVVNTEFKSANNGQSLLLGILGLSEEEVLVFNGDVLYDREILKDLLIGNRTAIAVDDVKSLTPESFKVKVRNGRIVAMGKGLSPEESLGEYVGLARISKRDLTQFRTLLRARIAKDQMVYYDHTFSDLSSFTNVRLSLTRGRPWTEIDFKIDLKLAIKIAPSVDKSRSKPVLR